MQLLLGSEVLDLSVQDSRHDQSHLFIRHPKVNGLRKFAQNNLSSHFDFNQIVVIIPRT